MEDSLAQTLQTLVQATGELCSGVENNEFESLPQRLALRERLLKEHAEIAQKWKELPKSMEEHQGGISRFGPLLQMLEQVDQKLVTLTLSKKEEAAERLKQAQNQKLLLAYIS